MADHDTFPSSSSKQRFPDWQREFEAAFLEDDPKKLPQLAEAAEAAMFLRLQALSNSPDGRVERDTINDAVLTLRAIQTEKLHYPKWKNL